MRRCAMVGDRAPITASCGEQRRWWRAAAASSEWRAASGERRAAVMASGRAAVAVAQEGMAWGTHREERLEHEDERPHQ